MLSKPQFDRTRRLALSLAGIELVERHRELLHRRTRRLGIYDSAGLDSLLTAVEAGESLPRKQFLYLLTAKFTGFFRHRHHFEIAAEHSRRAALRRGSARLWSAAAATGEEPYSLAMALIEAFESNSPPVYILATDLDVDALAVAQRGEYSDRALQALELARRERFITRTDLARSGSIAPAVRDLVKFRALNLAGVPWEIEGPFDVIFCRNVLMYMEPGHRRAVLERMTSLIAPDGLLMLDPAEHLGQARHLFAPVGPGVYSLQRKPATRRELPQAAAIPNL